MKRRLKRFLQKGLFLLAFVWGMSVASPMDAQAQLNSVARLVVEDQTIVEGGVVNKDKTTLSDGKGGTITYDETSNTLTIDNYTFTKLGRNDTFIYTHRMSEYQTFRIVLKGRNTMIRAKDKREWSGKIECFSIDLNNSAIIEGEGKLIANTAIGGAYDYVIKDCDLEVHGVYQGIRGDYISFQNANVTVTTDNLSDNENRSHAAALNVGTMAYDGNLTIQNSVVKVKTGGPNWHSAMIRENDYATVNNIERKIILSDDMEIVDEAGNSLNICLFDCWNARFFVFSKEQAQGTLLNHTSQISQSVYFISKDKGKQVTAIDEVVNAISTIGTVTLNSKDAIEKARKAYDALSSFGDNTAYVQGKVFNYQTLVAAENTYEVLKKQEEDRLAREAAEAAKKKQDKDDKDDKGNANEEKPDKNITIQGIRYTIKTPTFKSVKSKSKKTVTLKWTTDKKSTGYQISYSTSKKFKKSKTKTVTIKNRKTKTRTIKKLKSRKNYYIKIRGYKKVNGKKYYGYWSQVKKVKVK